MRASPPPAPLQAHDQKYLIRFCESLSILRRRAFRGSICEIQLRVQLLLFCSPFSQTPASLDFIQRSHLPSFFFNSLTKYYFSCSKNTHINNIANSFHPRKYIASRTKSGHEPKSLMYNPSNRKFTSKSYFIHPRLS